MSEILSVLVDYAWGLPLVFLLMGGGLYLAFLSGFRPLLAFPHALKLVMGKYHHKDELTSPGQLHHFKALTNALASTVGMGNISGVAIAIVQGGPGAIFWMWMAALFGMNTKFFECSLSVLYRGKDYLGEVQGGPMYVIKNAMPKKLHFLAGIFAVCGVLATMPLFNMNQLASYAHQEFGVNPLYLGIGTAVLAFWVLSGGVRSIGEVTSKLVPFMCVLYILAGLGIVLLNIKEVPTIFVRIFDEAFTGSAAIGGAIGISVIEIMKTGIKRAAFSNEAGVGTAPMAHSNAKTSEPISEGLVAMLGPMIDTLILCTITALVILICFPELKFGDQTGILITKMAFEKSYGGFGNWILGASVLLFCWSTVVGTANYMEKCWNYLFKGRFYLGDQTFKVFYALALVLGSVSASTDVINFIDICFAALAVPNMIATLYLAKKVKIEFESYRKRFLTRQN